MSKTANGSATTFVYDEDGRLLGEYDSSGALIEELVWLENLPIATLRPTGSGTPTPIAIYYLHADHLGTVRKITAPADNALIWSWENSDAFASNLPDQNPSGRGMFVFNLRLPGQYYDLETGTHYNYFRDYDPAVGRYEQSDPAGLDGGTSSYGYAEQSPLSQSDPEGLFPIPILLDDPIGPIVNFTLPKKVPGKYACNARCPTFPTGLSCPQNGCPMVYGYAAEWSLPDAINNAKSNANDTVPAGCQAKHCTYKCRDPKGTPIYPSPR